MGWLLGAAYFVFALATLSRQYTFDAISYLWDVENSRLSFGGLAVTYNFFHSQHLLFSPIVYAFAGIFRLFGYGGQALLPAQILNLAEGALTLSLVFMLMARVTGDRGLSLLLAALLGCTYAFWSNTAMVSDHMASCLLSVLFLGQLTRREGHPLQAPAAAGLGALNGLAFLMHQVNGLLGIVFIVSRLSGAGSMRQRARAIAIYTLSASVTAGIPYLAIGVLVLDNSTLHDFLFWSLYYAMPGVINVAGHYGTFSLHKMLETAAGFGAAVIGGFYWMNRVFETRFVQRQGIPALSAAAALAFAAGVIGAFRRTRATRPAGGPPRRLMLIYGTHGAVYSLLLLWWWPSYYQLWAVPMIGFVLLAAALLRRQIGGALGERPDIARPLIVSVVLVFLANGIAVFIPSHDLSKNDYYVTSMAIGDRTAPGDLIVIPGDDEYETYLPYFAHRSIVSLHAGLIDRSNDLDSTVQDITGKMEAVWDSGRAVWAVSELLDTVRTYADVYELHGLTGESVASRFRRFAVDDTIDAQGLVLYRLRAAAPRSAMNTAGGE